MCARLASQPMRSPGSPSVLLTPHSATPRAYASAADGRRSPSPASSRPRYLRAIGTNVPSNSRGVGRRGKVVCVRVGKGERHPPRISKVDQGCRMSCSFCGEQWRSAVAAAWMCAACADGGLVCSSTRAESERRRAQDISVHASVPARTDTGGHRRTPVQGGIEVARLHIPASGDTVCGARYSRFPTSGDHQTEGRCVDEPRKRLKNTYVWLCYRVGIASLAGSA
eukprot:364253-Chlamydomonas_euryale.AAC.13